MRESQDEIEALLFNHWTETVIHKSVSPFTPNWEWLHRMSDNNLMVTIGVRDNNVLVGHTMMMVSPHPHYGYLMASSHLTFVEPEYRGGNLGKGMLIFFEDYFENTLNGDVITIHFKTHVPNPPSLEKYGYNHIENVYIKYLGDDNGC